MPTPEDELNAHFAARDVAALATQGTVRSQRQQAEDRRAGVAENMDKHIKPVMERIRDVLLSRDLPAKIHFVPDSANGLNTAAISLHCSPSMADFNKPPHLMRYFAGYMLEKGTLYFCSNNKDGQMLGPGEMVKLPLKLSDLTEADANTRLVAFVKVCFPA